MSKARPTPTSTSSFPPTQVVVLGGIFWAAIALLYYLLFSAPTEDLGNGNAGRPEWYRWGTYIFQTLAIAASGFLCLRNWRSSKIASGRNVWLGLGIGVVAWGVGNLYFGYMDLIAKKPPSYPEFEFYIYSFLFVIAYGALASGMGLSVIGRRLNLFPKQWAIVGVTGLLGAAIAAYVTFFAGAGNKAFELSIDKLFSIFYAFVDVLMVIVSTILLLAFWGGRFAQSWRLLAASGIAMFVGDLSFNFAVKNPNYQSGDWVEFFWILAFVLFGMAAALEFDISSRPTSTRRKQ